MADSKSGFDLVWDRLPHLSWYQFRITAVGGVASLAGGFMSMYPVFAQYTPPYRCTSAFDHLGLADKFSFDEIFELSTDTQSCQNFDSSQDGGCFHCNFSNETVAGCDSSSFDSLKACLVKDAQEKSEWVACESYEYDRSLRENVTNLMFDKGEPWETAVPQFTLHCGMEWFDSLSTAMGLFGLLLGAFISGIYTVSRNLKYKNSQSQSQ
ncbi:Oidioi.mRNA.OKI2018_I69.PAR.g9888.t1.cds [Oikopleura dioica]|uniref:Oidioi.mRNA.OKI2018_I69.PAR.g9888.t1.cds n=1 Tax=Oikopleura dioica TaxID=34765 RepID=A0ABN7RT60_OIKDI|nr:Oidioi.mRNA.OKI2018_I69.PAR.g9888.t1.cds [Oikopleura dioica]